ncbi:MAG TPA: tRNA (N(6)-L-threonylcarbamoyladenosine(37)-C(2))-methylthiotransferase MtaB [Candidatus Nanoarchaeia archaeon]|nr:tRNA (N(6)-L-threonylcarbamoyladenosine(37)-C(2))-methylthiotransferase MtaB [Candidatus Nanoarchaeia archaeon]
MRRLSFKIYSLGCKVNQYDGGELGGLLESAGFILVKNNADLAIVNSCAVTFQAIAKSKEMIKKARQDNPSAKIILTGCLAKICDKNFIKQAKIDLIMPSSDFEIKKIEKLFAFVPSLGRGENSKLKIENYGRWSFAEQEIAPLNSQDRSRYFLKVQDGCEQFCSYCVIPFTRGKLQSRPMSEVLAEAEAAVKKGYREIVLCGIHLGLFGINNIDKKNQARGANLLKLLRRLVEIKNLARIRLSSIEITEVSDGLINFMAGEPKMCRHLHIPLQSGGDKILRLMRRPYDSRFFAAKIKKVRKKMPEIAISTDVIVGFPGETAEDFAQTQEFIKRIRFSRLHVFPFSPHVLTAAAKLPGRVETGEIKKRSAILRKLSNELAADFAQNFRGRILEVAVEQNRSSRTGKIKGRKMRGKTEYYFDVYFDRHDIVDRPAAQGRGAESLIGRVLKIKISAENFDRALTRV